MRTRRTSYRRNVLIALGSVLALLLTVNIAASQDVSAERSDSAVEPSKPFFPPGSRPFDRSFPEWSAEWWQYVFSIPVRNNPLPDETGKNCAVGQHGPVWFLVGSFSSTPVMRTCSIPQDRALFFPIINISDISTGETADELRAQIAPFIDAVDKLSVEVDGEAIEGLRDFRVKSVPFSIALPPDNLLGIDIKESPHGIYSPVVDDGFYVMLKPLSVGQHTIHIFGHKQSTASSPGEFSQDITYVVITVEVRLR
jgi:hypothetical protein